MAKTSAERQAAYRAKRAGKDSSERRLNTWVSAEVYSTIEKLARRYGITRRALVESLVLSELKPAESAPVAKPAPPRAARAETRKMRRTEKLPPNDVAKVPYTKVSKGAAPKTAAPNITAPKTTAQKAKAEKPLDYLEPKSLPAQYEFEL